VAVYYFHDLVHGIKWMGFFYKVLCKIGGSAVVVLCCLVFFVAGGELLPVCLTYVLWQSGQVSLYTSDREYLSCAWSLCVSRLANVYVVWNVILRSIRLKMFVIYKVSLPIYVKLAHFFAVWVVICLSGLGVGGLCSFIGKELLCRMLCIMFSSC